MNQLTYRWSPIEISNFSLSSLFVDISCVLWVIQWILDSDSMVWKARQEFVMVMMNWQFLWCFIVVLALLFCKPGDKTREQIDEIYVWIFLEMCVSVVKLINFWLYLHLIKYKEFRAKPELFVWLSVRLLIRLYWVPWHVWLLWFVVVLLGFW